MLTYIARRMMLMIPTLFGITAVVFFVMALAPGGFGGLQLGAEGALAEGDAARRIREYNARRYGTDQPAIVQYGRWLNQISPLGFRTSDDITFSKDDHEDAERMVRADETVEELGRPRLVKTIATQLAAYRDDDLIDTTQEVLAALEDPEKGLALLASLDATDEQFAETIAKQAEADTPAARQAILDRLNFEMAVRNRILFHRPTPKWPDLGSSLRGRPVVELLLEAAPITILLNLITIPIIYLIAVPTGILAARHRGKLFDVGSGALMLALWSVPVIWVGVLLIGYLANVQFVRLFPTGGLHSIDAASMSYLPSFSGDEGFEPGWLLDFLWHLALPIICLTYGGFAVLTKLMRGSILDNITADYVRTARAKGVDDHTVLFRHVFRNSMLPLITIAAGIIPALLAGTLIVETIFSIPGMGRLSVEAAFMKDREVVMGTTLLGGLIGLTADLIRDIWYAIADPRVTYE